MLHLVQPKPYGLWVYSNLGVPNVKIDQLTASVQNITVL